MKWKFQLSNSIMCFHYCRITSFFALMPMILLACSQSAQPVNQTILWYDLLPDCPCKVLDRDELMIGDGWAIDKGDIEMYHKGATICYRSYPGITTPVGLSGQQCCFDENGDLITGGSAAGTPDKVSTCKGENKKGLMLVRWAGILGHYKKDVKPWGKVGGWQIYNESHPPNQGINCKPNEVIVQ